MAELNRIIQTQEFIYGIIFTILMYLWCDLSEIYGYKIGDYIGRKFFKKGQNNGNKNS